MNKDIKKWHRGISDYIKSKNINNYPFIFLVPNGDEVHSFGYKKDKDGRIASTLGLVLAKELSFLALHCEESSHFLDEFFEELRIYALQGIEKRINKLKTGDK
jgi:hypothetical protein